MKPKNSLGMRKLRRKSALERLIESKFFSKANRTKEDWQKRKDAEIETLQERTKR